MKYVKSTIFVILIPGKEWLANTRKSGLGSFAALKQSYRAFERDFHSIAHCVSITFESYIFFVTKVVIELKEDVK